MAQDIEEVLARAGLQRSMLAEPGCHRSSADPIEQSESRWRYFGTDGVELSSAAEIERMDRLVIPPAWNEVWISPDSRGHIQATGTDAKGRRQYRYHPNWTRTRAEQKFAGLTEFGAFLPRIRKQMKSDLSLDGMPKQKVVALVVTLIDRYHIRVGNDEYARNNGSYGLTTLTEGLVNIDRSDSAEGKLDAVFKFAGKSGKIWCLRIWEDDLAQMIEDSGKVGGLHEEQDLFRYEVGDDDFDIKSQHINEYLDALTPKGKHVTAKDFRTWAATRKAASRLAGQLEAGAVEGRRNTASAVVRTVANDLGNTPAVARRSYIHPGVLSDWNDGVFRRRWNLASQNRKMHHLSAEETTTLHYLRNRGN